MPLFCRRIHCVACLDGSDVTILLFTSVILYCRRPICVCIQGHTSKHRPYILMCETEWDCILIPLGSIFNYLPFKVVFQNFFPYQADKTDLHSVTRRQSLGSNLQRASSQNTKMNNIIHENIRNVLNVIFWGFGKRVNIIQIPIIVISLKSTKFGNYGTRIYFICVLVTN